MNYNQNSLRNRSNKKRTFGSNRNTNRGKKPAQSLINPDDLIRKAIPLPEKESITGRSINDLMIDQRLKDLITQKGFSSLTEIQDKTLDVLCNGKDMVGIANTGTGKTAAFLIPIIHQLLLSEKGFQTLILVPTRELAQQVEEEFKSLTKGLNFYCCSIIGGTNINKDMNLLKRRNHLIVGTPGRVIDLMKRKALKLQYFTKLVLDEFDRMLDMGFINDVTYIAEAMGQRNQTILFSATMNNKQQNLVNSFVNNPIEVKVSSGMSTAEHIDQDIIRIAKNEDKFSILMGVLKKDEAGKVIIFAETKRNVTKLTDMLNQSGISADDIHGNKSQNNRKRALDNFRLGKISVLVATDVAARGIDVNDVTHVINYQLPQNMESYVHRIGRTGRAGKTGKATTLIG